VKVAARVAFVVWLGSAAGLAALIVVQVLRVRRMI
jgi:hypothetical protein